MSNTKSGPYSIGSGHWPGISKLVEEASEVGQVVGKLMGTGGDADHWDGSDLHERLHEELGDLLAAVEFVVTMNALDARAIHEQKIRKLLLFHKWHDAQVTK